MTTAPLSAIRPVRDQLSQRDLDADTRALVAIDVDAAEIIAANASGSAAFGLFPYASFPIALDPATPALSRLREIADLDGMDAGNANKRGPETLMFWSNRRPKPMTCSIARQGNGASKIFILRVIDGDEAAPTEEPSPSRSDDGDPVQPTANGYAAQPSPRSDAETLKEIARQIRESDLAAASSPAIETTAEITTALAASPAPQSVEHAPEQQKPMASPTIVSPGGVSSARTLSVLDPDHLAKLAHELKTPLTAIAAAAEVMRDERLGAMGNERYLSYASDIHESATHALDVITSLLSESGRPAAGVSRLIALDLNALVERTVSSMQALAQSRGLTLAVDAEASRPHVVANPTALRQILLNLLTNAIKFTPRNGDVRVVTGYLTDGRVFLVVRDTGCGMNGKLPATDAPLPDDASRPSPRGNGIGLPLVQRLVRDMGAEIEIDSAPQKGTAVLIAFGGFASWSA